MTAETVIVLIALLSQIFGFATAIVIFLRAMSEQRKSMEKINGGITRLTSAVADAAASASVAAAGAADAAAAAAQALREKGNLNVQT